MAADAEDDPGPRERPVGLRVTLPLRWERARSVSGTILRELERKSLGLAALDDIKVRDNLLGRPGPFVILSHPALEEVKYCTGVIQELAGAEVDVSEACVNTAFRDVTVRVEYGAAVTPMASRRSSDGPSGGARGQERSRSRSHGRLRS